VISFEVNKVMDLRELSIGEIQDVAGGLSQSAIPFAFGAFAVHLALSAGAGSEPPTPGGGVPGNGGGGAGFGGQANNHNPSKD